ncbi:hemolysin family protein [Ruminococcus sp. NK3A76]|uniref:hemolysin family protein n=1 Tax=Ruminococcus sp. NK3A76 TaxID=877411 RepID=UPI00048F3A32|nr:hemolysin family protein [Ruminococcus sp. NK3A76]
MDDVLRRCISGSSALVLIMLLFLFTAIESSILDCSENKLRSLLSESKNRRAERLLRLKDRRQAVKVTGIVERCLLTAAVCFMCEWGFSSELRSVITGALGEAARAVAYVILLLILVLIIPTAINTPRRLSGYEVIGERLALRFCGLYSLLMTLFWPVTAIVDGISGFVLRRSGVEDTTGDEPVSEEDILMLVDAVNDSGDIDENQAEMITNIFEFDDLEAKDVMTHRIDITGIERSSPASEAAELAINEGFSRLPVYDGTIDSLCGVIYSKDLLRICYENKLGDLTAGDIARDISFVPENIKCGELFEQMSASKAQIAALVDEYGGTAGIVTMEDLIEAIVGSIEDEFDEGELAEITSLDNGSFDVLGTARPQDVMEALGTGIEIPEEFDTIGGFVIDKLGFIPSSTQKPTVKWNDIKFTVLRADETKIEKLRIKKLSPVPSGTS